MRFSAVLTGILLGVVSIEGATINVTSLNESGSGSLRQAIFAGASGDTIQVLTQGKITLMKGELAINKSLIIIGPGMDKLTIDGNALSRVFHVSSNAVVTISDLTITNGLSPKGTNNTAVDQFAGNGGTGGGVLNEGTLVLRSCRVVGNIGGNGGDDSQVESPTIFHGGGGGRGGSGGGIGNVGTMSIIDCIVDANKGGYGGSEVAPSAAVYVEYSPACYGGNGGGIYNEGTLVVSNSIVSNNRAGMGVYQHCMGGRGGGLYNNGDVRIYSTLFTSNIAGASGTNMTIPLMDAPGGKGGKGGGLCNFGNMILYSSTVCSNTGGLGGEGGYHFENYITRANSPGGQGGNGGGIYNAGTLCLTNSTIVENVGGTGGPGSGGYFSSWSSGDGGNGGGICSDGNLYIVNSTVAFNTTGSAGAPGVSSPNDVELFGSNGQGGGICVSNLASIENTLIADNKAPASPFTTDVCGKFSSLGHNLVGIGTTNGVLIGADLYGGVSNPLDPGLSELANNGGITPTCALITGSLAIDAGDDGVLDTIAVDQRGVARPSGSHVDIGAFEVSVALTRPYLNASASTSPWGLNMQLTGGTVGKLYSILVSSNLTDWSQIKTVTNDTGTILWMQQIPTNAPMQFFRAQEIP